MQKVKRKRKTPGDDHDDSNDSDKEPIVTRGSKDSASLAASEAAGTGFPGETGGESERETG